MVVSARKLMRVVDDQRQSPVTIRLRTRDGWPRRYRKEWSLQPGVTELETLS